MCVHISVSLYMCVCKFVYVCIFVFQSFSSAHLFIPSVRGDISISICLKLV